MATAWAWLAATASGDRDGPAVCPYGAYSCFLCRLDTRALSWYVKLPRSWPLRPQEPGFELVTVPVPVAGEGEVVLKVHACSLCGTDVHVHDWDPPFCEGRLTPPVTTGHEVCGEVVAVGPGVDSLAVGDLVSAESHIPCASQGVPAGEECAMCKAGNGHIWCVLCMRHAS